MSEELGYRNWRILNACKDNPRLAAHCGRFDWPEKELTLDETPNLQTQGGLYYYPEASQVVERGYYPTSANPLTALGKIKVLGDVVHGEHGGRTNVARIESIYNDAESSYLPCNICNKGPATLVLPIPEGEGTGICENCAKRLKKLLDRKNVPVVTRQELLRKLADHYDVPLDEMDEKLTAALKRVKK